MRVSINVRRNRFPGMEGRFRNSVSRELNLAINQTVEIADTKTPVDSGALKGNKTIRYASPGDLSGEITWNQHYAIYQEFGTVRGVRARRFADSAVRAVNPGLVRNLSQIERDLG